MPADLIVKYQILAAQKVLEEKAIREYNDKWGFYLDFDKVILEEAKKHGYSEEEYKKMATKIKDKSMKYTYCVDIQPSEKIPLKSSEFIGFRSNFNLDKLATPYHINPKNTLPKELPQKFIHLG